MTVIPDRPGAFQIARGGELVAIVHSIEALMGEARRLRPGLYDVTEFFAESTEGRPRTSRAWGAVVHHEDGRVVADPIDYSDKLTCAGPFRVGLLLTNSTSNQDRGT